LLYLTPSLLRGAKGHYCNSACYGSSAVRDAEQRFWEKVDKRADGCWLWTGSKQTAGYGTFNTGRVGPATSRYVGAHRFSYELANGPIPDGLHLDHLCRTPACVNPDHLEAVTPTINAHRGDSPMMLVRRSGMCINGHTVTPENVAYRKDGRGHYCRVCRRERRAGLR